MLPRAADDISTHALHEEGDAAESRARVCGKISTHALHEEGDTCPWCTPRQSQDFYPRPPRGGRPERQHLLGRDHDFYPRPPRGGRPAAGGQRQPGKKFLPTPSTRRATRPYRRYPHQNSNFYPRPPRGGRHRRFLPHRTAIAISTHALHEEGDPRLRARI